jgi:uncharacterized protein YndB with AHSA1/START domain
VTEHAVDIDAPAAVVYDLISDPLRMAEWSPECARCRWIGGAERPVVGARFRGTGRNGRRRWTTTSTITGMQSDELFAWDVTYFGQPVARWEYRIEPHGEGVRLVESVEDQRGPMLRAVSPVITGSPDRAKRNADTMKSTLQAVKAAAEAAPR